MDALISIGKVALTIFEVVLLFNLMIVVHELGHYWAAKWRGLKVDRFQIWFGKPLWHKEVNGVKWGLGWIPAGGFVALPQMAPMETIEGGDASQRDALPKISPLDKIIVAFAGPLFSLLLAVVLAVIVNLVGTPMYTAEKTTTVGWVAEDSGAEEAGMQRGDKILKINDTPVDGWYASAGGVMSEVAFSEGPTVDVTVIPVGQTEPVVRTVPVAEKEKSGWFDRGMVRRLEIDGAVEAVVAGVTKGGPAERAGMLAGDRVVAVNDQPIEYSYQVTPFVDESEGKELTITVSRKLPQNEGVVLQTLKVTPQQPLSPEVLTERYMLGLGWGAGERTIEHPSVGSQISRSATAIFKMFGALLSPTSDVGVKDMGGPVAIGRGFYAMLSDDGWMKALALAVLINVNLAILNMMPLPVLDGGHIVMAIGEWIRKKPMSGRVLEVVQTGFAIALLSLMAYLTILDTKSFFGGGTREPLVFPQPEGVEEAPSEAAAQ
ncbi:RIP metalloprotease RseP [Sulfuriroseicoccus oceanibius]|uniref:Zinc metalloprotease n=1 Tax=Sulfuriroseicoccus oceanibius TaxID=2707525 RepID=A0A6B3LEW4_9BACT|nr:RIP metalloprotease RseP [Sulfuriroseicoccus oceanibius]QQL44802.1 RIP metalloprotease RseP [Sulfuriroseicoccus oceanibius]